MGSLTIIRTKDQLAISTGGAFTALDEVGSATVSTAAVIPSGVSKIVNIQISATNDAAEETLPVVLLSGNALPGGDTYALGAGIGASPTGNSNYTSFDSRPLLWPSCSPCSRYGSSSPARSLCCPDRVRPSLYWRALLRHERRNHGRIRDKPSDHVIIHQWQRLYFGYNRFHTRPN